MLLVAYQAPTIAQGTWARLPSATSTPQGTEADQIRVFPLALHRLTDHAPGAPVGPVAIECETPLDPMLMARMSA